MGFETLDKIFEKAKRRFPGFDQRLKEADALSRWQIAVGPAISKQTRARSVKNGVLVVEVSHPIWKSELHYRKKQIIDLLNQGATDQPPITDIFFVDPMNDREGAVIKRPSLKPKK